MSEFNLCRMMRLQRNKEGGVDNVENVDSFT